MCVDSPSRGGRGSGGESLLEEGQEEEQTETALTDAERRMRVCVKEEGVTRAAVAAVVAQYEEAVRVELVLLCVITGQSTSPPAPGSLSLSLAPSPS